LVCAGSSAVADGYCSDRTAEEASSEDQSASIAADSADDDGASVKLEEGVRWRSKKVIKYVSMAQINVCCALAWLTAYVALIDPHR